MKPSHSSMTYQEKAALATQILQVQGYDEKAIAKIILLSFGKPPKVKNNGALPAKTKGR